MSAGQGIRGTLTRRAAVCAVVTAFALGASGGGARADVQPPFRFAPRASGALPGRVFTAISGASDGESVVLYGGEVPDSGTKLLSDTWVHTPDSGWVAMCGSSQPGASAPCGPGPRGMASMAIGPTGPVLFGGSPNGDFGKGGSLSDTWVWNGTAWAEVCADGACGPSGRAFSAMAGNGGHVVLFGGLTGDGAADDTWIFDGQTWKQTCGPPLPTACGPAGLVGAALAWDGTEFVLAGGATAGKGGLGAPVDDTWTFNGTTWTQACGTSIAKPCGPRGREVAGFTFEHQPDPSLQGAVLMGGGDVFGNGDTTLLRDAWIWRAGAWTQLPTSWDSSAITFPNNDNPPVGSGPLVLQAGSQPGSCQIVAIGADPVAAAPTVTLDEQTVLGGWDVDGTGQPGSCTKTPAAPTTTVTTAPDPAPDPAPTLPATGHGSRGLGELGSALVALGLLLIAATRCRASRQPGHVHAPTGRR